MNSHTSAPQKEVHHAVPIAPIALIIQAPPALQHDRPLAGPPRSLTAF